MSVKKRRQAKALQRLAAKLPLTNLGGAAITVLCALVIEQRAEFGREITFALVGALAGLLIFLTFRPRLQQVENRWRARLRAIGERMEAKLDQEQGSAAKLMDVFELEYFGGHPGWTVTDKPAFGQLELWDKYLVFKNRNERIKLAYGRIHRAIAEDAASLRSRKPARVVLRKPPAAKNPIIKLLRAEINKRQLYVALDYQDDMGERHWVVFSPVLGVPWKAKAVKAGLDELHRKVAKDRKAGTGALFKTGNLPQASEAQIAEAEAASRRAQGMTPEGTRYQVVIRQLGRTTDERAQVSARMAEVFQLPSDKLEAALARLPFVAKRHLTLEQANQWAGALQATGATVHVVAMTEAPRG